MDSIPAYFTQGEMTQDKRDWLERQVNGLEEGVLESIQRLQDEQRRIRENLKEMKRILEILKGGKS